MALLQPKYLDCVTAIGKPDSDKKPQWVGSGFLYGRLVPSKTQDAEKEYITFLVTNRHVLSDLDEAIVRFNPTEDRPANNLPLPLKGTKGKIWFEHPNPEVDVDVVIVSTRTLKEYGMQVSFFTNDVLTATRTQLSELGVAEGDFVYTLGFPMGLVGQEKSFPIARLGIVARIRDAYLDPTQDYLLDASIFPGNSGGPVVLKPEIFALPDTKAVNMSYLIGLVRGYVPYRDVAISLQTKKPRIIFEENSGLAEVVPIDRVNECIENALRIRKLEN